MFNLLSLVLTSTRRVSYRREKRNVEVMARFVKERKALRAAKADGSNEVVRTTDPIELSRGLSGRLSHNFRF